MVIEAAQIYKIIGEGSGGRELFRQDFCGDS